MYLSPVKIPRVDVQRAAGHDDLLGDGALRRWPRQDRALLPSETGDVAASHDDERGGPRQGHDRLRSRRLLSTRVVSSPTERRARVNIDYHVLVDGVGAVTCGERG